MGYKIARLDHNHQILGGELNSGEVQGDGSGRFSLVEQLAQSICLRSQQQRQRVPETSRMVEGVDRPTQLVCGDHWEGAQWVEGQRDDSEEKVDNCTEDEDRE